MSLQPTGIDVIITVSKRVASKEEADQLLEKVHTAAGRRTVSLKAQIVTCYDGWRSEREEISRLPLSHGPAGLGLPE